MKEPFVTMFAYAKINLALAVLGVREDGYHELQSVMQSIALHDVVKVRRTGEGLVCHCGTLSGKRNLAYTAAEMFFEELGLQGGAEIHIDKHIPIQAGLAGGSSDAAAALRLLNQLYNFPLREEKLRELSARCGADVVFCLRGGTAWATGRGEQLEELSSPPPINLVLVKPQAGVNTREAYRYFDEVGQNGQLTKNEWEIALAESPQRISSLLYNDLEGASIRMVPEISDLKRQLLQEHCYGALMSGSGSSVFGIARSGEHAEKIAAKLRNKGYRNVWATKTVGKLALNK